MHQLRPGAVRLFDDRAWLFGKSVNPLISCQIELSIDDFKILGVYTGNLAGRKRGGSMSAVLGCVFFRIGRKQVTVFFADEIPFCVVPDVRNFFIAFYCPVICEIGDGIVSVYRHPEIRLVLVLAALTVAGAIYLWLGGPNRITKSPPVTAPKMASEASPERPSIAVLPFNNLSADKEQTFFCDGITSDIITDLTKFRQLSVAAAHTVFQYKGRSIDIRELGRELNVGYLLMGSIQKTDNRMEMGHVFFYSGQTERAIQHLETGLRVDPDWRGGMADMELGLAYYLRGRYEDAVNVVRRGISRDKDFVGHYITLAATYAQMGRVDDAETAARKVLTMHPFFEVSDYGSAFRNPLDREKIADGLRKAGLK